MKKLELLELKLKNFKGIENFSLLADGYDVDVLGKNATGKTTTFDGFTFLLFGKDSTNKTDFEIKGLDEDGKVKQHGLEHTVEGFFKLGDERFSLKRVYMENWTKKRGSNKKVFSGHSTKYYIDDVPKKKKEYDEKISSIISEDVFKLLTNPLYFNESIDWKKRREILIDIAGDVTDSEILEANKDLESIMDKLMGKTVDDLKDVIKEKKKIINDELDKIPVRIDEILLSMDDISQLDKDDLKGRVDVFNEKIDKVKQDIESVRSGAKINDKRKELSEVDLVLAEMKNKHEQEEMNEIYKLKAGIQEKKSNASLLENKIESFESQIKGYKGQIRLMDETIDKLRSDWLKEDAVAFNHNDNCICPTCNQDLPEEQINEVEKTFNINKAKKLEGIVTAGNSKKEEKESLIMKTEKLEIKINDLRSEIDKENSKITVLESDLKGLQEASRNIEDNSMYKDKKVQKQDVQAEISRLIDSENQEVNKKKDEIYVLEEGKAETEKELLKFDYAEKSKKRVKELEEKESQLSAEFEQLEEELFKLESYVRTKISLLESKINSKFKYAKFKLFEEQINAGIKETCEVLDKGIPYSRGLNNANRINIGLDVINTLTSHFGVSVPIFIDNSESITDFIDTESQTVKLTVSRKHKELTILQDEQEESIA